VPLFALLFAWLASCTDGGPEPGPGTSMPSGGTLGAGAGGASTSSGGASAGTAPAASGGASVGGTLGVSGGAPASSGGAGAGGTAVGGATAGSGAGAGEAGSAASGGLGATGGSSAGGAGPSAGSAGEAAGAGAGSGSGGLPPVVDCPESYQNPVIWEDLPDVEVIRVNDVYYYTASTFHHSPGAPILRSYDLVNWEYIGHSVPALDFDPRYDLRSGNAYVSGIWASTLQYRPSNETFYWMGCMHGVGGGYVFTAKSPTGPWEKHRSQQCYYDMGLLIDDDDKMYVASGNNTISVAELSADGFGEVRRQEVYQTPSDLSGPLEGSRFIKTGGMYYIFTTQYANGEYVLRSASPFGPYEMRPFAVRLPYAGAPGSGASPHQGGVVETTKGDWYYMAFNDSFPGGRLPVMAPITWADGWPSVTLFDGKWGGSYPFPDVTCREVPARPTSDTFSGSALRPEWEWNHHADDTKWSVGAGLTLQTATVTNDLYAARNTLTQRVVGPVSTGTIELDYSAMADGDVAGLAALRDSSAWIGVKKANGAARVVMTNGLTLAAGDWNTTGLGTEVAGADISGGKIWLRAEVNIRTDSGGGTARFSYSTDGAQFSSLGNSLTLNRDWQYFLGYRFGIFNFATEALGGSVNVASFDVSTP